ncbi:MAG: hypothetical protein WKG07_32615 [Hymenobacter sp.]
MFVVQQGETFQGKLRPFTRPLSYPAFIDAERGALPLADLPEYLAHTQELVLRGFSKRLQLYLQLLCENDLVPIDITKPTQPSRLRANYSLFCAQRGAE